MYAEEEAGSLAEATFKMDSFSNLLSNKTICPFIFLPFWMSDLSYKA
jgi:hypothetical protein